MRRRVIGRWICAAAMAILPAAAQAALPMYGATQLAAADYRIVKRIWSDHWRTGFDVPRDATREAALERLLHAVEEAGADAVVNAYCLKADTPPRGYFCYGNAVRLMKR